LTDDNVDEPFNGNVNTYKKVYYTRENVKQSSSANAYYAGLILPFTPEVNADYAYHVLDKVDGNNLMFKTVNEPMANVPYLFENRSNSTTITIESVEETTIGNIGKTDVQVVVPGNWTSIGVYTNQSNIESYGKCYAIKGGVFTQYNKQLSVKPYRVYWQNNSGQSLANFMLRTSRGDVTAIKMAELDESILPTVYYDLSGRMVNNPVKGGIYIVNGKKVVF